MGETTAERARLFYLGARNYKALRDVRVQLGPVNALVGPNGAGKSTFLDVIRFLGDSIRSDLRPAIEGRGGYENLHFRGDPTGAIQIRVGANITAFASESAPDEYSLTFFVREPSSHALNRSPLLIRSETFTFKRREGRGRRLTISGTDVRFIDVAKSGDTRERAGQRLGIRRDALGLATLPKLPPSEGGDEVSRVAEIFSTFRVFEVDGRRARMPSLRTNWSHLTHTASNLSAFLEFLWTEYRDVAAQLQDDAAAIIPGFQALQFRSIGGPGDAVAVGYTERGLPGTTFLADASLGTVRALALLAMLHDPDPPPLTCVEELDYGLHPWAFDRITERLREASRMSQFIVATHSPAFVNRLEAGEIIVCERDSNGAAVLPALSTDDVRAVAEGAGAGLGEVWFTGSLGGVPI